MKLTISEAIFFSSIYAGSIYLATISLKEVNKLDSNYNTNINQKIFNVGIFTCSILHVVYYSRFLNMILQE
jgi:hypothetical protein